MYYEINSRSVTKSKFFQRAATATGIWVYNCPGLTALPDLPSAANVRVDNCPGLTALPDLPSATRIEVHNCPGIVFCVAGAAHGNNGIKYEWSGIRAGSAWRIVAGCRNFTPTQAAAHWAENPAALRLCQVIADVFAAYGPPPAHCKFD